MREHDDERKVVMSQYHDYLTSVVMPRDLLSSHWEIQWFSHRLEDLQPY